MNEWFYSKGGAQEGPFEEAEMRTRITSGQVGVSDLLWREGMAEWLPLAQVSEFSSASASSDSTSPYVTPETNPASAPQAAAYAPIPPTSGLAIASLVCGILAILSSCVYVGILFGIPAVITGHMAMKSFKNPQEPRNGKGMAIAGLVCGYLGSLITLGVILFGFLFYKNNKGMIEDAIEEAQRQQQEQIEEMEKAGEKIIEENAE